MMPPQAAKGLPADVQALMEELLGNGQLELPVLPGIAHEVVELCHASDSDAADLRKVIHRDPVLASRLLRVANSVQFGSATPIESLQQAIVRMGMSEVSEIALAATTQGRLFNVRGQEHLVTRMWRHALASAYLAKEIAKILSTDREAAFLCGLLHDVGEPVILSVLLDASEELGRELEESELREAMHFFHCFVGGLLAEQWHLPEKVRSAILHHHDHESAGEHRRIAMITCLTDEIVDLMFASPRRLHVEDMLGSKVLAELGIDEEKLAGLLDLRSEIANRIQMIGGGTEP